MNNPSELYAHGGFFALRPRKNRRGQVLPMLAVSMVVLLGVAGLVFDVSAAYFSYSELQISTNAATLAGAEAMSVLGATTASVTTAVNNYSAQAGKYNAHTNLPGVSMVTGYPKLYCSTYLTGAGYQCTGPGSTNAIEVSQQVSVPTTFAKLFGVKTFSLKATSTAATKGAAWGPFNVAIIVDSTASMGDNDSGSGSDCNATRISCALAGVQILLQDLSPCLPGESNCAVTNAVDRVSLFTFPAVSTASAPDDYCGKGTTLTTEPYATPFPTSSTYQIVNFSSNYRTSDTATLLSPSSNLVKAVGYKTAAGTTVAGCLTPKGGEGTYYAQIIYAAQTQLAAEKALYPTSQNVLILLSDGDAPGGSSQPCNNTTSDPCSAGPMIGAWTKTSDPAYPNTKQECHQAITAAQAATAAGTRVYAVAYGAEASGCATDTNPTITPCQTMEQIASSGATFFSDYEATGGSSACISASQPATSLNQIFTAIAGDLTVARLLPNGTP